MTILAGKIDESVVEILTSESGVLRYEEVSGATVNPFTVDADTLGGSTKEEIISEAQSGLDLSNIDAVTLGGQPPSYYASAESISSIGGYVVGSYSGNDADTVKITVGFKPKAVFICGSQSDGNYTYLAMLIYDATTTTMHLGDGNNTAATLKWEADGVTMSNISNRSYLNSDGSTYKYIAFK